jgi:hypothetical protein
VCAFHHLDQRPGALAQRDRLARRQGLALGGRIGLSLLARILLVAMAAGIAAGSMMPLGAGCLPMMRSTWSPLGPIMITSPAALDLNL